MKPYNDLDTFVGWELKRLSVGRTEVLNIWRPSIQVPTNYEYRRLKPYPIDLDIHSQNWMLFKTHLSGANNFDAL